MNYRDLEFLSRLLDLLIHQASYRFGMPIEEVLVLSSSRGFQSYYYICPRCHITMEREYMTYCDRCGQCLNWKGFKKARKVYPGFREYDT